MEIVNPGGSLLNSEDVPGRGESLGEVELFADDFLVVFGVVLPVVDVLPDVKSKVHDVLEVVLFLRQQFVCGGQARQFRQILFSFFDHDVFEIDFVHPGPTLGGGLGGFGFVVEEQVLVADGFQDPEALDQFIEAFFGIDDSLLVPA